MSLLQIVWDVSPELIALGPLKARWYGFLFGAGYIVGYYIFVWIYKREGIDTKEADTIFLYTAIGGVVGARLGHIIFYDLDMYIKNPAEMLYIWHGGLASHGGALGILLMMALYCRRHKYKSYLWIVDKIVIPTALGGMFIRFGNFFNSEIIGQPTELPWGVVFAKNFAFSQVPRHPSQLYEAFCYLIIFIILLTYYKKQGSRIRDGQILGWFLVLIFAVRFVLEFTKENQVSFENTLPMNMGQLLSIPLVLAGLWLVYRHRLIRKS